MTGRSYAWQASSGQLHHVHRGTVCGLVAAGQVDQVVDQSLETVDLVGDEPGGGRRPVVLVFPTTGQDAGRRSEGLQR